MITLYGIPNCDTIRKARRWFKENQIDYLFHDFRKDGLDKAQLTAWVDELGWEKLLNKCGTTWRKLSDEQKNAISRENAIDLMLEFPAMIKRPVLDTGNKRIIGFREQEYQSELLS